MSGSSGSETAAPAGDSPIARARAWIAARPVALWVVVAALGVAAAGGIAYSALARAHARRSLIQRDAPRLIVLIGGMGGPEDEAAPRQEPWPEAAVRALLGAGDADELRGLDGSAWPPAPEASIAARIVAPATQVEGGSPPTYALAARGNGPDGLVTRARDAIADITDAVAQVERSDPDGRRVALILVGHSFGGLIARTILAAPTQPIGGSALTERECTDARAIADRTICVVTLGSPHEGAALADVSARLGEQVARVCAKLRAETSEVLPGCERVVAEVERRLVGGFLTTSAIRDLRTREWATLNTGAVAPGTAQRRDGSLVPIYVAAGHTPAGRFFADPNQGWTGGMAEAILDPDRHEEVMAAIQYLAIDLAYRVQTTREPAWGAAESPPLDRVRRHSPLVAALLGSLLGASDAEQTGRTVPFPSFFEMAQGTSRGDGETDTDGLVPVDSALGWRLGTPSERAFDHTRDNCEVSGRRVRGSWYRIDDPRVPWLRSNHGDLVRDSATARWIRTNILAAAGPHPGPGPVSEW
jgi:triacylglycerol esterase/lipase EstA (alpha/beta hydrolase family)